MSEEKKTPFLEVKDLEVVYSSGKQTVHAVNGVSFSLQKGRSLGLVGETGAGKTTIAKAILRILPRASAKVKQGQVFLNGTDLLRLSEESMRDIRGNEIAMIFQDPMTALNPILRVGNQITEAILHHSSCSKAEAEKRAMEMLEMVGIPSERFGEYPHQFSGGMKQRVVIAIALACSPALLLADEPTTALDVTIQAQVLRMISELKAKLGTSMILITHDMGVVASCCDDVAIVYAGQIVEYGTLEQVFDHPSHPYTQGLFRAIPSMNVDQEYLEPIEGLPPDPTHLPEGCCFSPRCKYASEACKKGSMPVIATDDGHVCRCCRYELVKKDGSK